MSDVGTWSIPADPVCEVCHKSLRLHFRFEPCDTGELWPRPRPKNGVLRLTMDEFDSLKTEIFRAEGESRNPVWAIRDWLTKNGWDERTFAFKHTTVEVIA